MLTPAIRAILAFFLFSSTGVEFCEGKSHAKVDAYLLASWHPVQTKNRRAHECAAGNRLIGMAAM
jgi:hypothetical protein